MNFKRFINKIIESVKNRLPECDVNLMEVIKNNNVNLKGVSIRDKNVNAAPTIYLEQFYEAYLDGENFDSVVDSIIDIYENNKMSNNYDFDYVEDYDLIKKDIYLKAVNFKRNKKFLEDVVHKKFLDLALVPYIFIDDDTFGSASVIIHNDLFESWKINEYMFFSEAMDNMNQNFEYKFLPIMDVIQSFVTDIELGDTDSLGMYVLYPNKKLYGASLMACKCVMEDIAERLKSNFYIIPSSVHELIIVKDNNDVSRKSINEIISDVNKSVLSSEDILSDHVYYYSQNDGVLM